MSTAEQVSPEIQKAYDDLLAAFSSFMEAFQVASAAGIDVQAVLTQNLRAAVGEEGWAQLPISVKMMLG